MVFGWFRRRRSRPMRKCGRSWAAIHRCSPGRWRRASCGCATQRVVTRFYWSRRWTNITTSASRATQWRLATISTPRATASLHRSAPTWGNDIHLWFESVIQSVYSLHSKAYEWRAFSLYRRLQDQNWKTQQKATRKLKQKKLLTKRNRTKRSMTKADRCESRNRCELSVPWQIEQTKIWELMHRKSIRKPRLAYIQKTFRFHVPDSSIWW